MQSMLLINVGVSASKVELLTTFCRRTGFISKVFACFFQYHVVLLLKSWLKSHREYCRLTIKYKDRIAGGVSYWRLLNNQSKNVLSKTSSRVSITGLAIHEDRVVKLSISLHTKYVCKSCKQVTTELLDEYQCSEG